MFASVFFLHSGESLDADDCITMNRAAKPGGCTDSLRAPKHELYLRDSYSVITSGKLLWIDATFWGRVLAVVFCSGLAAAPSWAQAGKKVADCYDPLANEAKAKVSYAQSGEDLILDGICDFLKIEKPTYLDIGAADPIDGNNSYLFYKKGASRSTRRTQRRASKKQRAAAKATPSSNAASDRPKKRKSTIT